MSRKGREFELAYQHLYDLLDKNIYTVTSPAFPIDKTTGKEREVDVLVEYNDNEGKKRRISIECRDRSKVQDITWIEQLVQKKEDLDLDYMIATTTTSFSQGAIDKAKYHGIIIEKAEMPSAETLDELRKTMFADFFFFYFELLEFRLYVDKIGFVSLKDYLKNFNIFDQNNMLKEINTNFLYSIEPREIIDKHPQGLDFFRADDNNLILSGTIILEKEKKLIFKNAKSVKYKIKVTPRKVSLPIVNSFSVFNVEEKSNKKYRADFENNNDHFYIGYIDNKLDVDFSFKRRRYWRTAGGNISLNTIIPDGVEFNPKKYLNQVIDNHLGEFDMSKIM